MKAFIKSSYTDPWMCTDDIEAILIAVLMAEHPRLGVDSVLPYDIAMLVAKQFQKDVSYLMKYFIKHTHSRVAGAGC